MPRYKARVRLDSYVEVTVVAEDEDTARDFAITAAYEESYPQISDADIEWIEPERDERPAGS